MDTARGGTSKEGLPPPPASSQHTAAAPCCPRMSRPHVLRRKCHNLSVEPARLCTGHVDVGRASKKQILGAFQLQGMPSAERPALTPSLPMGMIYGPNDCHCLVFPPLSLPGPPTHTLSPHVAWLKLHPGPPRRHIISQCHKSGRPRWKRP